MGTPLRPSGDRSGAADATSEEVGALLRKQGLRLATAESCTGGLIGNRITRVSGSSEYFTGGVIAYANDAKVRLLGVRPEDLDRHGAVSEEVARQMAIGARRALDADVAVSITGIMGPTGGTPEKPVGLAYVGVATLKECRVRRIQNSGEREQIQWAGSEDALRFLADILNTRGEEHGGQT